MARLDQEFNVADAPEREEFTPVPPGAYTAMIVESELKKTNAGGEMIVLEIDIQEGEHAGRKIFERLNIKNENSKAVDIAYRTLAEIGKALGMTTIKDTAQLHNKRMTINVKVDPAKPYVKEGVSYPGSPQNGITRFLPYAGGAVKATTQTVSADKAPEATQPSQADTSSVPPWKRKKV